MRDARDICREQRMQGFAFTEIYKKILGMCENTIEESVKSMKKSCIFKVPTVIIGEPFYLFETCFNLLIIILNQKHYKVIPKPPNILYIIWEEDLPPPQPPNNQPIQKPSPVLALPGTMNRPQKVLDLTKI
jgi:hypothetical protein